MNAREERRFFDKVEMVPIAGCWLWSAHTLAGGYGAVFYRGSVRVAHAVAYEHFVGPVPEGLELDHKCRVRCCVNPDHLEPVTHVENMRRGHWATRTHCKYGHPLSGENVALRPGGSGRRCRQCSTDARARRNADPIARAAQLAYWRERSRKRYAR